MTCMCRFGTRNAYAPSWLLPPTSEEAKCLEHTPEYVLYTDFLASKAITARESTSADSDATLQQVRQ